MKKIAIALTIIVLGAKSFAQTPALSKDHYLKKSKTQKTTGWILLGGGTAMIVAGAISYPKHGYAATSLSDEPPLLANDIIILIGAAADIISIPFFISAHKNKKRAASIAIASQKIPWYQKNNVGFVEQPSFTIKVRL